MEIGRYIVTVHMMILHSCMSKSFLNRLVITCPITPIRQGVNIFPGNDIIVEVEVGIWTRWENLNIVRDSA